MQSPQSLLGPSLEPLDGSFILAWRESPRVMAVPALFEHARFQSAQGHAVAAIRAGERVGPISPCRLPLSDIRYDERRALRDSDVREASSSIGPFSVADRSIPHAGVGRRALCSIEDE
jgi:hypothetical protein